MASPSQGNCSPADNSIFATHNTCFSCLRSPALLAVVDPMPSLFFETLSSPDLCDHTLSQLSTALVSPPWPFPSPSHSVPPQARSLSNANGITALPLSPHSCSAVLWMTSSFLPCACQTQPARPCQIGSEASTWAPSTLSTGGRQPFAQAVPSASLTLVTFSQQLTWFQDHNPTSTLSVSDHPLARPNLELGPVLHSQSCADSE